MKNKFILLLSIVFLLLTTSKIYAGSDLGECGDKQCTGGGCESGSQCNSGECRFTQCVEHPGGDSNGGGGGGLDFCCAYGKPGCVDRWVEYYNGDPLDFASCNNNNYPGRCTGDPNTCRTSHLACVNYACVEVQGGGADSCQNNKNCCNANDWSGWSPACTPENCDSATQERINACDTKQTRQCSCTITYTPTPPPDSTPTPTPPGGASVTPSTTPTPTPISGNFISWFKTRLGDVHSNKDIIVSIPSLHEYFSTFLVTVNNLSSFAAGSEYDAAPYLASEKKWYSYSPYGQVSFPELSGFYEYYIHIKPAGSKIANNTLTNSLLISLVGNGVNVTIVEVDPPGNSLAVNEALSLTGNRQLVLYINGDLNINSNIIFNDDSGVIFVVKGNLNISSTPTEIDGMYLVDRTISTGDTSTPLKIKGALFASLTGKIFGQSRKVNISLPIPLPSEEVIFEPKYLIKFSQILGRSNIVWREVAP